MTLRVADVRFTPGDSRDHAAGLLGYLAVTLDGSIRIDGLTLRRTRSGRPCLSFPRHRGGFRPLNAAVRRTIEDQILAALRVREGAP